MPVQVKEICRAENSRATGAGIEGNVPVAGGGVVADCAGRDDLQTVGIHLLGIHLDVIGNDDHLRVAAAIGVEAQRAGRGRERRSRSRRLPPTGRRNHQYVRGPLWRFLRAHTRMPYKHRISFLTFYNLQDIYLCD